MELSDRIRVAVLDDPTIAPDLLRAVTDGLDLYKQTVDNKRSNEARNSIMYLMSGRDSFVFMIDAAFFQFPKGLQGHCQVEIEFWNRFVEKSKKQCEIHSPQCVEGWIVEFKGLDCLNWWDEYIKPLLKGNSNA